MTTEQEIAANKELRQNIEALANRLGALPASLQRNTATGSLRKAIVWIDLDTKRLNAVTPVKA